MTREESRLLRHLVTAVLVKLAVLALLWWAFVHEHTVPADAEQTAEHLGGTPTRAGAAP